MSNRQIGMKKEIQRERHAHRYRWWPIIINGHDTLTTEMVRLEEQRLPVE